MQNWPFDVLRGKIVQVILLFPDCITPSTPQKYKKMPLEDEHVGYLPGKNPNFGHVSFSGFENTAVQSICDMSFLSLLI